MRFVFTCGGTAGHINPAIAIAEKLRDRYDPCDIVFIGADGQMEMDLVPREGYKIFPIKITNISRGHDLASIRHNMDTVRNVLTSTKEAKKIIREYRPDAVIGTGGYVCYPVITAAHELGIPTVIHESNAAPGLTTRLLCRSVDRILVGFEDCRKFYPDQSRVEVTGTPVRGSFSGYTKEKAKKELGISEKQKLVLSVWGSLGAGRMNEIMLEMIPEICKSGAFHLIHATGKEYYEDFCGKLTVKYPDFCSGGVDVRAYIHDMAKVMIAADLILCRGGASTLSELTYLGKPAIIVPSPNVTNNHQEKNARVLEQNGGVKVITEENANAAVLLSAAGEILSDPEKLKTMEENMRSLSVINASETICEIISQLI